MTIEELEKNNELFANALALKIVGEKKMLELLKTQLSHKKAINILGVYVKFLENYEKQLLKNI